MSKYACVLDKVDSYMYTVCLKHTCSLSDQVLQTKIMPYFTYVQSQRQASHMEGRKLDRL
jgi:hypothetical protein